MRHKILPLALGLMCTAIGYGQSSVNQSEQSTTNVKRAQSKQEVKTNMSTPAKAKQHPVVTIPNRKQKTLSEIEKKEN